MKNIQKPFSSSELADFCGQLAMILKSGISTLEGLRLLQENAEKDEKAILDPLIESMEIGLDLSTAMEDSGLFPDYALHTIRLGEETGTLDEVLSSLQIHYTREVQLRRSLRSAVTYPAAMTGMMIVVILVLLVKVMPLFNQVFLQLGSEMTGISRALMDIGGLIGRYSAVLIIIFVLIAALVVFCCCTKTGKTFAKKLGYRISFVRNIFEKTAASRFAGGMALALRSGLNPERGMELVKAAGSDPVFLEKISACEKYFQEGCSLAEALTEAKIFSGLYVRMVAIGAKTGAMDQVMEQIADMCQDELDSRLSRVISVLEPTLVILLSLIVGVILLSVMLPLMGIMSSI